MIDVVSERFVHLTYSVYQKKENSRKTKCATNTKTRPEAVPNVFDSIYTAASREIGYSKAWVELTLSSKDFFLQLVS